MQSAFTEAYTERIQIAEGCLRVYRMMVANGMATDSDRSLFTNITCNMLVPSGPLPAPAWTHHIERDHALPDVKREG